MNWGIRIAFVYVGFVALIMILVFTCLGQKVDLESKDYYAKEINYQGQIDATKNANELGTAIQHVVSGRSVELSIPVELIGSDFKGEAYFFRPSDSGADRSIQLKPDANGKQVLKDAAFIKGVYKMKVSFSSNGKHYYKEDVVFFN